MISPGRGRIQEDRGGHRADLPVMFVISFIVPGVLLQWETLRQVVWIEVR